MIENIEGLKTCNCGGDSLPNRQYLTDTAGNSSLVLICPECGGQIEFGEMDEKERREETWKSQGGITTVLIEPHEGGFILRGKGRGLRKNNELAIYTTKKAARAAANALANVFLKE